MTVRRRTTRREKAREVWLHQIEEFSDDDGCTQTYAKPRLEVCFCRDRDEHGLPAILFREVLRRKRGNTKKEKEC